MALASNYPQAQGLYDPAQEHDACGVAMVATLNKVATHEIVAKALTALRNMEHRGASGAEPDSGDGAGILIRVPDAYALTSNFQQPMHMQQVLHLWHRGQMLRVILQRLPKKRV